MERRKSVTVRLVDDVGAQFTVQQSAASVVTAVSTRQDRGSEENNGNVNKLIINIYASLNASSGPAVTKNF